MTRPATPRGHRDTAVRTGGSDARAVLADDAGLFVVFEHGEALAFSDQPPGGLEDLGGDGAVRSPMPGKVTHVAVQAGQAVEKGQLLMVLEAMKMEHSLTAPIAGVVDEVLAREGGQTTEGALLVRITAQ